MEYTPYYKLVNTVFRQHSHVKAMHKNKPMSISRTGVQLRFEDLDTGPEVLMTQRFISIRKAFGELLWVLSCSTDTKILHKHGVYWWDAYPKLGPIYGEQLNRGAQLKRFFEEAFNEPYSRRLVLNFWNPIENKDMCIPPCITSVQYIIEDVLGIRNGTLIITQRSADILCGLPYDILMWQLFGILLSKLLNTAPIALVFNIGSAHIYRNQFKVAKKLSHYHAPDTSVTNTLNFRGEVPSIRTFLSAETFSEEVLNFFIKDLDYERHLMVYRAIQPPVIKVPYNP